MKAIIMAGGHGERLWPLSRAQYPKQLVKFPLPDRNPSQLKPSTLLTETFERLESIVPTKDIFLSIQKTVLQQTSEALPTTLDPSQFILEPQTKDTTTAILLSLLTLTQDKSYLDEVFFFTPADHYIAPLEAYKQTLELAEKTAQASNLLTIIGIKPQHPATEYGYIDCAESTHSPSAHGNLPKQVLPVSRFHEKPDLKTATTYLEKGNFLWNAGMFFCKAGHFLQIFRDLVPDRVEKLETYLALLKKGEMDKALSLFSSIDKVSFDYAIAEKLDSILCVPAQFFWDDLGSIPALERIQHTVKTPEGNIFLNKTHAFATENTFVHHSQEKNQTLVLNGLKNLAIVITEDVIYITDKTHGIPTKAMLKTLTKDNKSIL